MGGSVLEEVHSTFDVQLDDDGLMVLTLHRGLSVGAELAQQVVNHLFDLVGDRRVVMLLRIAGVRWATSEVQAVAQTFTPSIVRWLCSATGRWTACWRTSFYGSSTTRILPAISTTRPRRGLGWHRMSNACRRLRWTRASSEGAIAAVASRQRLGRRARRQDVPPARPARLDTGMPGRFHRGISSRGSGVAPDRTIAAAR